MAAERRILIFGASYGSLMASKMLLAGHRVALVCTAQEASSIAAQGISVRIPMRGIDEFALLNSNELPGKLEAVTPARARPERFDLAVLAMQEPQYRAPELRDLLARTASAGTPCLSIMNMPPLPFLQRFEHIDIDSCRSSYTEPSVWDALEPGQVTHSSADPQASRSDVAGAHTIDVRLATNFRSAAFADAAHNLLLQELAASIRDARLPHRGAAIDVPVKLTVADSRFTALSKWPMLITGNYRCITGQEPRSIESAVHHDVDGSRTIYDWVCGVCTSLGAAPDDVVPFDKYAAAARALTAPSSAARALDSGAKDIERVDRLVQSIARTRGMTLGVLDEVVARVDALLEQNRTTVEG